MESSAIKVILSYKSIQEVIANNYNTNIEDVEHIDWKHGSPEEDMLLKIDFIIYIRDRSKPINCQLKLKSFNWAQLYKDLRISSLEINPLRESYEDKLFINVGLRRDYKEMSIVEEQDVMYCTGLAITTNWNIFRTQDKKTTGLYIVYDDNTYEAMEGRSTRRDRVKAFQEAHKYRKDNTTLPKKTFRVINDDCIYFWNTVPQYYLRCIKKTALANGGYKCFLGIPIIEILEDLRKNNIELYREFSQHAFFVEF